MAGREADDTQMNQLIDCMAAYLNTKLECLPLGSVNVVVVVVVAVGCCATTNAVRGPVCAGHCSVEPVVVSLPLILCVYTFVELGQAFAG